MKQDNYPNTPTTRFNRWMLFAGIAMLSLFATGVNAQIAVTVDVPTNTTPNLAASYTDLATALTAVNSITAMSGPVVLTLSGSETAPIKGFALGSAGLNASLNATNTLTFVNSGTVTINAGVGTAASPNVAAPDAMFIIAGCDYVTLDGLTFTDGNSASATVSMETGVGLFKLNASDGAQYNTIKNCTFNMQRINNASGSAATMQEGSIAIRTVNSVYTAAITSLTITTAGGTNSYNKFYTNTINGGNAGISLNGFAAATPFTTGDTGNDVGGSASGTGNFIYNYGGGATTNAAVGIRANNQWGVNISYNTIDNNNGAGVSHATTLRGIYAQAGTSASATINNNTITLRGGATTSTIYAIENAIGSTAASNTININNNTINGSYLTATSGVFNGILNSSTAATVNINGNTVQGTAANSLAGTGTMVMIEGGSPAGALNTNNNIIQNISRGGASGTLRALKATTPTGTWTCTGNLVDNLSFTAAASTGSIDGIYDLSGAVTTVISTNIIRNLSTPTTGTINGIRIYTASGTHTCQNNQIYNFSTTSGGAGGATFSGIYYSVGNATISGNTIYSLNSTGTTGGTAGTVYGIWQAGGTTNNIYKNKIYDLSSTSTNPVVAGINISSGTTNNVYNNIIGNLQATAANAANPLIGINISGGSNCNANYNTVYLNGSSSGALFGSSGIYASTTPTVSMRNNLVVNTSTSAGASNTAAHRRSSGTTGVIPANYAANSNNNLFYAGTPSATNLIYVEGTSTFTNDKATIADYKTFMSSRDQAAVTENPSFASTTGSSSTFLHFAAATVTLAESGAALGTGITDDFDSNLRQDAGGYGGTGTSPDIGADEFEGSNPAPLITGVSITPSTNQCTAVSRAVSSTVTPSSGTLTSVVLNYSFNGTPQTPISMTNSSGNIWDATIPVASPANATVTWSIVATNTVPFSTTYSGTSYTDAPWTGVSTAASANPTTVCAGGSTLLSTNFVKAGSATVGAGAGSSSSNPASPFNGGYGGNKTQFLYTAAELLASGLVAGNITSVAFDVTFAGALDSGFAISMGHSALTEFGATVTIVGGLTDVYTPTDFQPVLGINTFTLTTPFAWNGTSNLIISFCWSNNNASNTSSTVRTDATVNYSSQSYRKDNETKAALCAFTGATGAGTFSFTRGQARAQLIIGGNTLPLSSYSWSDGTNTVGSGYTLSQSPTASTIYTVTATTNVGSCTTSATVSVTVDDLAITGTTGTDLSCYQSADGEVAVTATSTAGGHMFSLNGGTPQASGTFTGLAAGFYTVVVTNANSCSATTTITLTEPTQVITVASNDGPVCDGATVNLGATGAYVSYAWTGPNAFSASGAAQSFNATLADAGVYTVVATDGIGCTGSSTTTLVVNSNFAVSVTIAAAPSLSVCTGDTVTFTASPTNGGTTPLYEFFVNNISAGAASASNTYAFVPNNGDQVYVQMNSDITCTSNDPANSDTVTVSVSGAVAAAVSLSPSANNLCGTASVTFTASPTAGGTSPTYEFFVNNISAGAASASNTYAYTPADDDTVRVVMTSSFACATGNPATSSDVIMAVFTVPSNPIITPSGATTFCAPGTITLTSSYTGGNVWSTTETTDAIVVSASGSYTVTYTDGNGCSATSAAEVVTVNIAVASIGGSLNLCTGSVNILTASASPAAVSYLWSPGGQTTDTIHVLAGGSYSVQTTDANGCTDTESVIVTENAIPSASISGNSSFCTGVPELLTATASAGSGTITTYQWVLNGSTNVGTNSSTYSATAAGSYTVIVTNSNGCSFTSTAQVLTGVGPLNGTYTIDNGQAASCTNYLSFADAFSDLNTYGVGGNVVFNVEAGQTHTGNLTLNMCSLGANAPNASQTLAFRKSGAGANPLITAGTGSGTSDAIVKIVGVDYLTFDGIDLQENVANTTDSMRAEAGYALLKCSGTDGAQNDTIKNCTVTLNKANPSSVGIYAPNLDASFAAVTVTATSGSHSNNKFFSNTVSNSYFGIILGGMNDTIPYALYDHNNELGAVGNGNSVSNLGGGSTACYGIFAEYQDDFNLNGNTINTGASAGTGLINALRLGDMRGSNVNVDGNTITLKTSAASTTQCIALRSSAGSRYGRPYSSSVSNVVNITNNTIENCTYTGSNDLWMMFLGRASVDTLTAYNLNVTGNQLINNTSSSTSATGTMYGIICQATGDSVNISNNNISTNTMNGNAAHQMRMIVTGYNSIASGSLPYSPKFNVSGNTLLGNTSTATTAAVQGIMVESYGGNSSQAGTMVYVTNNQVGAATLSQTTGAFTGISSSTYANTRHYITGNKVYNITRNAATTGAFTGITAPLSSAPLSYTIENDTVSGISMTAGTTTIFTGINSTSAATQLSSISSNVVSSNTVNGTGAFTGIANTTGVDKLIMSSNFVNDNYKSSTGTMSLISTGSADTLTMNSNTITNNRMLGGAAASTLNCVIGGTSKYVFNGNTIQNNYVTTMTGTSIATVSGYTNALSPTEETVSNNIIRKLYVTGTSSGLHQIRGIYHSTTTGVRSVYGNVIDSLYTNTTSSAAITGIISSTGGTVSIYKNKIYDMLTGQNGVSASISKGISITAGTAVTASNNLIGVAAGTTPVQVNGNALQGIEITGGTAVNLYYNTIRVSGNGSGTAFGTSGINISSTTPVVTLKNNLVLNLSGAGGAAATNSAVALRRSAAAFTGYSSASDKNIWYAGTPSGSHLLYFDGTTSYQTLASFKAAVTPREAGSQTENVTLLSTTGANANFLHVDASVATTAESGGVNVGGITDDYDNEIRQGNVGYVGTGTSPDVGADEFGGISATPFISNVIVTPSDTCVAQSHSISADVTTTVGVIDSVRLSYSFNGVAQTSILMTVPTSGSTYTFTVPVATPTNAIVTWSLNGWNSTPLNYSYTGTSYQDEYMVAPLASASPDTVCLGESVTLLAGALPPATPAASTYCASTHTSGCSTDAMLLVVLNTLSNPSVCAASPYYTNFSGVGGTATTTLSVGGSPYSLAITFGTDGSQYFGAWIDYNHNGTYEATEFLGASGNAGSSGTIAVSFSIPATAYNGVTRMRIVGGNDSPVTSAQPCGASSSAYGETEDYDVTITGATDIIVDPIFTTYSWFDGTNTYTGNPAIATPTTTGIYTYTLTAGDGSCSVVSSTDTVEVLPIPAMPVGHDSTQCGNGAPFVYVQGTPGATFNWYDAAVGGTLLQSSIDTTYTTSINATQVFYVAEVGTNGCSGLRVMVTATVTSPDPIDAQSTALAVCPGTSFDLSVIQTGSTNNYNYTWNAVPSSGSGISGTLLGSPVTVTPTFPGTYNYIVTAVDGPALCVIQDSVSVLVYNIPTITSVSAVPDTICAGDSTVLTALTPAVVSGVAQIGTGTSVTSTYPYYRLYGGSKTQMLYLASELTAAGLSAGNITTVGFNITALGTTMYNASISLKNTASTTCSAFETGLTQVASYDSIVPVLGVNSHSITPFAWNGTSNLLVEFCLQVNDAGATSSTVTYSNPGFAATFKQYADNVPAHCTTPTGTTSASSTIRPNLYINGQVNGFGGGAYTWTWNPGSLSGNTVTVAPTTTTNYTVTALDVSTTCSNSANVSVMVNPTPPAPTAFNGSHCGELTPTAYVTRSQAGTSFNWYFQASGGTAIPWQNDSLLVAYPRNQQDTFYVAEVFATGPCEGPRSMVVEVFTGADAIIATATVPNDTICPFGTVTLSATQGTTNTYTTYTWTTIPAGGTASGQNTTATVPNLAGQLIWVVTASDGTCSTVAYDTITVTTPPVLVNVMASEDSVCPGTSVTLSAQTADISSGIVTLGTSTTTIGGTNGNPYRSGNGTGNQVRTQLLVTAAELTAAGIYPGNMSSLGFTTTGVGGTVINFEIKMGHTAATALTTTFETSSLTSVYTLASFTAVLGLNTHTFSTPFVWNGTSNVLVEVCQQNDVLGTNTVSANTPAFAPNVHVGAVGGCTALTGVAVTGRPIMTFGAQTVGYGPGSVIWAWNPGAIANDTAIVSPTSTTVYTVTATDPNPPGCYSQATVSIYTYPEPLAPINPVSLTQCGSAVPLISVTRSGAGSDSFKWYTVSTGGTAIAGETDSVLTSLIVSATTTFYVAEFNGDCEGPRTAVTITVNQPDLVTINASDTSVCLPLGSPITLDAIQSGSTSVYVFTWSANPSGTAGLSGTSGPSVTANPTATGTYTYTVSAVDAGAGCASIVDQIIEVNVAPVIGSVTASNDTVCAGSPVVLTAATYAVSSGTAQIGTATTTTTTYPYYRLYGSSKTQMLYRASELTAAGLFAGNLTSIGFYVTAASTAMPNVKISMKNTASTTISAFETGMTQVATEALYTPVVGQSSHPITPFYWNGTSNLIVEFCFENNDAGGSSTTVRYSNPGFAAVYKQYQDNAATHCSAPAGTTSSSSTIRPNLYLNGQVASVSSNSFNWTWNPGSLTNDTVTVNPTVTTTYTVTAAAGACTDDSTVTIVVNPVPATPTANNSVQCGTGTPTCSVNGGTGSFNWYLLPTGGIPIAGQTNDSLFSYPISVTDTFYVSEDNDTCESGRVMVIAVVNPVDTATATISTASFCLGGSATLTAVQTGSVGNTFTYTWTPLPEAGSGITDSIVGNGLSITPTSAGTYVYTLTAQDGSCNSDPTTVTLLVNALPTLSIGSDIDLCFGSSATLTATTNGVSTLAQIGTGTSTTSTYPYYRLYGSSKTQMLYRASELTAAGLVAGNISSVGFYVTAASSAMPNVRISMKNTAITVLTASTFETGLTQVATEALFTPVVGVNNHPITPFYWDGTSNLIVEYCFENNDAGASSTTVRYSNPGFSAVVKRYADTQPTYCSAPTTGTFSNSSTIRPNLYLAQTTGTIAWSSIPGGFSDNTVSVSTGPVTSTTQYVATVTNVNGCVNSDTLQINVATSPGTYTITAAPDTICTSGSTVLTVSGLSNGTSVQWQSSPSGLTDTWTNVGSDSAQYTTGTLAATTYFRLYASCGTVDTSSVKEILVVVPSITSTTDTSRCGVGQVTVLASGNGDINWYTASTGGTLLYTGSPFVDTIYATTVYYVQANIGTCSSGARVPVVATLNAAPIASFIASSTSVCDGETLTLTASSSNGGYTYYWSLDGTTIQYTGNPYVLVPDSTMTFWLLAVDSSAGTYNLCASYDGPLTVTWNEMPVAPIVTPATSQICTAGDSTLLTVSNPVLVSPGNAIVGTATTTTSTSGDLPYEMFWEGQKKQLLFTVAELNAAGLVAGPITALSFDISAMGATITPQNDYKISLAHTASIDLSAAYETGLTLVYGPVNYTPTAGINTHTFSAPFAWNGTSNIVVDICSDNDPTGTCTTGSPICYGSSPTNFYTATTNISVRSNYGDNSVVRDQCNAPTGSLVSHSNRPNVVFAGYVGAPINYTWNPGGATGVSVYVTPTATTTYTVTATLGICSATGTAVVNYTPVPLVITPSGSTTFCGSGTVTLDTIGSDPGFNSFSWSDGTSNVGTTPAITVSPTVTTIYTLTAVNTNGCTVEETITVTVYPAVSVTITPSSTAPLCGGVGSVTLTADAGYSSYLWSPGGETTQAIVVSPVATTTYTVSAVDGNGCTQTGTYTVNAFPAPSTPTITASVAVNPLCWDGVSATTFVTLTADTTGAGAGSSLSWNDLFSSSDDFIDVYAVDYGMGLQTFTITVTNLDGCQSTASINVDIDTCVSGLNLDLTVFLEGYIISYGPTTMWSTLYDLEQGASIPPGPYSPNATDSIEVNLWSQSAVTANIAPDYSEKVILNNDGSASITYSTGATGYYYIAVRHRNTLETWSKDSVDFTSGSAIYDFSTALTQAFDDGFNPPMQNMSGVYALYSGDVNQDFTIDGSDLTDIDNDNNLFAFGYNVTDCTGDGATDSNDIIIVDNNKNLFLFYARPY